jgi:hypothetical protein
MMLYRKIHKIMENLKMEIKLIIIPLENILPVRILQKNMILMLMFIQG